MLRQRLCPVLAYSLSMMLVVWSMFPLSEPAIMTLQPLYSKPYTPLSSNYFSNQVRGPIEIDEDSDFTWENGVISGSGKAGDPYLIEGWEISISGKGAFGIRIANTRAYFIIRNVRIRGSGIGLSSKGIVLHNVRNGRVENTEIINVSYGIKLVSSSFNNVTGNLVSKCWDGIIITNRSNNNTVRDNISKGNIQCGIVIHNSDYNTIINNTSLDNGHIDPTVNGKGISIYEHSYHNMILNNKFINNSGIGIFIHYDSPYNRIVGNTLALNEFGILCNCNNTCIYWNNFLKNQRHVFVKPDIIIVWSFRDMGNYWDNYRGVDVDGDGIGETINWISQRYKDPYPLVAPYSPNKPLDLRGFIPVWHIWATAGLGVAITLMVFLILKTRVYTMSAFYASAILADITMIGSFTTYLIDFSTRIILRDLFGIALRGVLIPIMIYLMRRRITSEFALRNFGAYLVAVSYGLLTPLLNPNYEFLRPRWLLMSWIGLVFGMSSVTILLISYTLRPPLPISKRSR